MAVKKAGTKGAPAGVTFTSEVIRHTNSLTVPADSTTAAAEAIPTPGYSEAGYSGALIVGVQVSPKPGTHKLVAKSDSNFTIQLQSGDHSETPELIDPDAVGFFAQIQIVHAVVTSGMLRGIYPLRMPISMPVPIIVLPKMTICVDASANVSELANTVLFTEIFYRTVRLADRAYTGLLLQQQRTS